jgi:hypothetical protein
MHSWELGHGEASSQGAPSGGRGSKQAECNNPASKIPIVGVRNVVLQPRTSHTANLFHSIECVTRIAHAASCGTTCGPAGLTAQIGSSENTTRTRAPLPVSVIVTSLRQPVSNGLTTISSPTLSSPATSCSFSWACSRIA